MENAKQYLMATWKRGDQPLLLGLSGGVDSMALFHLLQECQIPFIACHIHHHLRRESDKEAKELERLCKEKNIPFRLHEIFPKDPSENSLREKRWAIFQLYKNMCQALVLGHHADDQAETVLKRFFEGASLQKMGGMSLETTLSGFCVIRPLLLVRKQALYEYVHDNHLPFFEDETNYGGQNLRSKMRVLLLPVLKKKFGKDPTKPLLRFGKKMHRFHDFIQSVILKLQRYEAAGGIWIKDIWHLHPFLFEHICILLHHQWQIKIYHEEIEKLVKSFSCKEERSFFHGSSAISLEKKGLFIIQDLQKATCWLAAIFPTPKVLRKRKTLRKDTPQSLQKKELTSSLGSL